LYINIRQGRKERKEVFWYVSLVYCVIAWIKNVEKVIETSRGQQNPDITNGDTSTLIFERKIVTRFRNP